MLQPSLYRAVDNAELDDIMKMSLFRGKPTGSSTALKFFWFDEVSATKFSDWTIGPEYPAKNIIKASIPEAIYSILLNCNGF